MTVPDICALEDSSQGKMPTSAFKHHNIPALCCPLRKAFHSSSETFLHWTSGSKVKAQPGSFLGWTGMPLKLSFTGKMSVLTKVWDSGSRVEGSQNCNLQDFQEEYFKHYPSATAGIQKLFPLLLSFKYFFPATLIKATTFSAGLIRCPKMLRLASSLLHVGLSDPTT